MPETKQYGIIYADPPWRYDRKHGSGVAENHYPTMSIEEICALPVSELAAKDSTLFLWATFPQLNEAFRVIDAWGFKYKTIAFQWIKLNRNVQLDNFTILTVKDILHKSCFFGLGRWTRGNTECCLLATKGKPKRINAGVGQLIFSPIEKHSKKPLEARKKIKELMGECNSIELFARESVDGWDCWGDEV